MSARIVLVGLPEAWQVANGTVTFHLVTGPGASALLQGLPLFK